jgi:hypothetical protein
MSENDITIVGFTTVIVAFPTSINKELILRKDLPRNHKTFTHSFVRVAF